MCSFFLFLKVRNMTVILIDASIISVLFCQGRGIASTEQIAERETANTSPAIHITMTVSPVKVTY